MDGFDSHFEGRFGPSTLAADEAKVQSAAGGGGGGAAGNDDDDDDDDDDDGFFDASAHGGSALGGLLSLRPPRSPAAPWPVRRLAGTPFATGERAFAAMPGFGLVVGATNRPNVLDPALLRPGRFDRHVEVTSQLHEIMKHYR